MWPYINDTHSHTGEDYSVTIKNAELGSKLKRSQDILILYKGVVFYEGRYYYYSPDSLFEEFKFLMERLVNTPFDILPLHIHDENWMFRNFVLKRLELG